MLADGAVVSLHVASECRSQPRLGLPPAAPTPSSSIWLRRSAVINHDTVLKPPAPDLSLNTECHGGECFMQQHAAPARICRHELLLGDAERLTSHTQLFAAVRADFTVEIGWKRLANRPPPPLFAVSSTRTLAERRQQTNIRRQRTVVATKINSPNAAEDGSLRQHRSRAILSTRQMRLIPADLPGNWQANPTAQRAILPSPR